LRKKDIRNERGKCFRDKNDLQIKLASSKRAGKDISIQYMPLRQYFFNLACQVCYKNVNVGLELVDVKFEKVIMH